MNHSDCIVDPEEVGDLLLVTVEKNNSMKENVGHQRHSNHTEPIVSTTRIVTRLVETTMNLHSKKDH